MQNGGNLLRAAFWGVWGLEFLVTRAIANVIVLDVVSAISLALQLGHMRMFRIIMLVCVLVSFGLVPPTHAQQHNDNEANILSGIQREQKDFNCPFFRRVAI